MLADEVIYARFVCVGQMGKIEKGEKLSIGLSAFLTSSQYIGYMTTQ